MKSVIVVVVVVAVPASEQIWKWAGNGPVRDPHRADGEQTHSGRPV